MIETIFTYTQTKETFPQGIISSLLSVTPSPISFPRFSSGACKLDWLPVCQSG